MQDCDLRRLFLLHLLTTKTFDFLIQKCSQLLSAHWNFRNKSHSLEHLKKYGMFTLVRLHRTKNFTQLTDLKHPSSSCNSHYKVWKDGVNISFPCPRHTQCLVNMTYFSRGRP